MGIGVYILVDMEVLKVNCFQELPANGQRNFHFCVITTEEMDLAPNQQMLDTKQKQTSELVDLVYGHSNL